MVTETPEQSFTITSALSDVPNEIWVESDGKRQLFQVVGFRGTDLLVKTVPWWRVLWIRFKDAIRTLVAEGKP